MRLPTCDFDRIIPEACANDGPSARHLTSRASRTFLRFRFLASKSASPAGRTLGPWVMHPSHAEDVLRQFAPAGRPARTCHDSVPSVIAEIRSAERHSIPRWPQAASTMSAVISTEAPRCRKSIPITRRQPARFCSKVPVSPTSAPRQTRTVVPGSSRSSGVTGSPA